MGPHAHIKTAFYRERGDTRSYMCVTPFISGAKERWSQWSWWYHPLLLAYLCGKGATTRIEIRDDRWSQGIPLWSQSRRSSPPQR